MIMVASNADVKIRKRADPRTVVNPNPEGAIRRIEDGVSVKAEAGGAMRQPPYVGAVLASPDEEPKRFDVGYGKPPLETRFSSENQPAKRGRKARPKSQADAEELEMNRLYPVLENGKTVMRNGWELAARARRIKAFKGDFRAAEALDRNRSAKLAKIEALRQDLPLNEAEAQLWDMMVKSLRGEEGPDD